MSWNNKNINKAMRLYNIAKETKIKDSFQCPTCKKMIVKNSYQKTFCNKKCKDKFWNNTDAEKRCRKTPYFYSNILKIDIDDDDGTPNDIDIDLYSNGFCDDLID